MGIRLDWQVEAEQTETRATEDPATRQRRRRARNQLLLLIAGVACLLGMVGGLALWRLDRIDAQYRQDLFDTVAVEVTALRVGDFADYMSVQRSASDSFMLDQSRRFEDYQQLKQTHRVELTGEVVDYAIDDLRARVIVEEIIDGVPYHVVWFYWYYEDGGDTGQGGWRRVPDDLTFWGDEASLETDAVTVNYQGVDAALADALAPRLQDWWTRGCVILSCATQPPPLTVEIVAERPAVVAWASYDPWTLRISSPLVARTRADVALPPDLARAVMDQVAARLVQFGTGSTPAPVASDAAWLRLELARWLGNLLLAGADTAVADSGFMGTLVMQHGLDAAAAARSVASSGGTLDDVFLALTGLNMPLLSVDQLDAVYWVDFFQWRLALEQELLSDPATAAGLLDLYDLDDLSASSTAQARLADPAYALRSVPQVISVALARDAEAQTYAYVETTRQENGVSTPETIIWRLASGTWRRIG